MTICFELLDFLEKRGLRNISNSLLGLAIVMSSGCTKRKIPDIGSNIAGPTAARVCEQDKYLVLNSDFERIYTSGSLLSVSVNPPAGENAPSLELQGHAKVPPIGRQLLTWNAASGGAYALASFGRQDEDSEGRVALFDISDCSQPVLLDTKNVACDPINIHRSTVTDNDFFASCIGGQIFYFQISQETADTDPSLSQVELFRNYEKTKRAMATVAVNDRPYLFLFSTDLQESINRDALYLDNAPRNEIPDAFEDNQTGLSAIYPYLYCVVDINKARSENFEAASIISDITAAEECHLFYGELTDADGNPDDTNAPNDDRTRLFYRTNIYSAQNGLDPNEPSIYISHRGDDEGNANIIKLTIKDGVSFEPQASVGPDDDNDTIRCQERYRLVRRGEATSCTLYTEDTLEIQRVYPGGGSEGKVSGRYPTEFKLIEGPAATGPAILVNTFLSPVDSPQRISGLELQPESEDITAAPTANLSRTTSRIINNFELNLEPLSANSFNGIILKFYESSIDYLEVDTAAPEIRVISL